MILGGAAFCIGAILCAFAQDLAMLIIGRVCLGAGVGFANQVCTLPHIRCKRYSCVYEGYAYIYQAITVFLDSCASVLLTLPCQCADEAAVHSLLPHHMFAG